MRQLGTRCQMAKTAGYPIVGQFEFLQVGQCREALQRRQADIDETERFQCAEVIGETNNAGAAAIVQNEFGDLLCVISQRTRWHSGLLVVTHRKSSFF